MNLEIKNRYNNNIIIVGEYDNIKDALEKNRGANLCGANLCEANLRGADLCEANLCEANLRGAKEIKLPIISLNGSAHSLFYINGTIRIGCEEHTIDEWVENYKSIGDDNNYSEEQITEYGKYIIMIANIIKSEVTT